MLLNKKIKHYAPSKYLNAPVLIFRWSPPVCLFSCGDDMQYMNVATPLITGPSGDAGMWGTRLLTLVYQLYFENTLETRFIPGLREELKCTSSLRKLLSCHFDMPEVMIHGDVETPTDCCTLGPFSCDWLCSTGVWSGVWSLFIALILPLRAGPIKAKKAAQAAIS